MGRAVAANATSAALPWSWPSLSSPHTRRQHCGSHSGLCEQVINKTLPYQLTWETSPALSSHHNRSRLHSTSLVRAWTHMFWFLLFQVPVPRPGQTRKRSMRATILVILGIRGCCCPRASETCSGRTSTREPFVFLACAPVPPPPPGPGSPAHHGLRKPVRGDPAAPARSYVRPLAKPV